jgi:hypothetical protein
VVRFEAGSLRSLLTYCLEELGQTPAQGFGVPAQHGDDREQLALRRRVDQDRAVFAVHHLPEKLESTGQACLGLFRQCEHMPDVGQCADAPAIGRLD